MAEPMIPDRRTLRTLAEQLVGKVSTGADITRERLKIALASADMRRNPEANLMARISEKGDSGKLRALDRIFSGDNAPSVMQIKEALGEAGSSQRYIDDVGEFLVSPELLDNLISRKVLEQAGFDGRSYGRLLRQVDELAPVVGRGIGKTLAKKGLIGGLATVAAKMFAGPLGTAMDLMDGMDIGDGEIPSEMKEGARIPSNAGPLYGASGDVLNTLDRLQRRDDRRAARQNVDIDSEVIKASASPTSGNNIIMKSLGDLVSGGM